jgi:hypothetical protein
MDEVMASAVFVICGAQRRLLVSFTNDETPGSGPSLMTLTMLW